MVALCDYSWIVPTRPSPQTDRVVQLFELLAADPGSGLSLAEVSRRLGVHKAGCHSMLTALLHAGWLLRDPVRKTYQLGPALVRLGAAAASRFPALDLARPVMAELSASTGAHCIAFEVSADHVTVVDQIRNPRHPGHPMAVGTELPIRPPYGASVAAWLPDPEQRQWLAGVPDPVRGHYRRALQHARERGFAVGLHVLPDVRLQELASLIRANEIHHGRLSDLAVELTDELMHREEWFPTTLAARRSYQVSHLDSAVFGRDARPVLMISAVPVESALTGAEARHLGDRLRRAAARITGALGGSTEEAAAGTSR
jgi:DNA-binding IclR family transcriptional regulator